MRIAIRCCCDPQLVLGTIEINGPLDLGDTLRWPSLGIALEVAQACDTRPERLKLDDEFGSPYATLNRMAHLSEVALKSNETPLEQLRRIPSFTEINRQIPIGRLDSE